MKKLLLALTLSVISLNAVKTYGNVIVSKVISVYDGDTFRANIATLPPIVGQNIGIRLFGIDTPELRDKDPLVKELAYQARDYARQRLFNAQVIELVNLLRGKYFRIVAQVWVDGADLGQELIDRGLAVAYDGGTKPNWSELVRSAPLPLAS